MKTVQSDNAGQVSPAFWQNGESGWQCGKNLVNQNVCMGGSK